MEGLPGALPFNLPQTARLNRNALPSLFNASAYSQAACSAMGYAGLL
jgi:hypothetical protein